MMGEIISFPIQTKKIDELDAITNAQTTPNDQVLVFDESVGVWKSQTLAERDKAKVIPIDDITNFSDFDYDQIENRQQFHLNSFAPNGQAGGGSLLWGADIPKMSHDGIIYFSPTVPAPADFNNPTDVQNYRDGVGEEFPADDGVFVLTSYSIESSETPSIDEAIAVWDGESGTRLKNGVVPTESGNSLISIDNAADVGYARLNADNTASRRTLSEHKTDLSLNNVDNTSDSNKPVSSANQAALDLKAPLASPVFTGNPTAPTPAANDNDTSIATTAYVQTELLDRPQVIENVAALATFTPVVEQVYKLKEYNLGTGKGGGELLAKSGAITPDNVTTFASATSGVYFERINLQTITLDMAGVTNPAVDNLIAIKAACQAAGDRGLPLKQTDDNYYGVSGNLNLNSVGNLKIYRLSLKQLTPSAAVRTIFKNQGDGNIELHDVRVDRNGTADASDTQTATDAAGLWLTGFENLIVDGLEVFGDGKGIGFLTGAISGQHIMRRLNLHDMTYYHPTEPTTEYLSAMTVLDQSTFDIDGFKIMNIYSKTGTDPVRRVQTDGLGIGGQTGASRFSVRNGFISNVGEGIDITGSGGSFDFDITNVRAEDCGYTGFKMANGNNTGRVINCSSVRSGWCGIALVGAGADIGQKVGNFIIDGCFIYDTGVNPEISGGSITYDGIQLGQAGTQPLSPYNVSINNTLIIDRNATKTMDYGIRAYDAVVNDQNVIISDSVIIQGFKVKDVASRGATNTFGRYVFSRIGTTGSFSHPTTGSWVLFVPNSIVYDENAMHSAGSFTAKTQGLYDLQCSIVFNANATGIRGARVKVNGTIVASTVVNASASDSTGVTSRAKYILASGDIVTYEIFQSSGGALILSNTGSFAEIARLSF